jgi:hypothetical protein
MVHMFVEIAKILAEIIDGNAAAAGVTVPATAGASKAAMFAQDRDEANITARWGRLTAKTFAYRLRSEMW